jgi:hypothetical protein
MGEADLTRQPENVIRGEAADNFFKVAAMAAGTLALLDEHDGAGTDRQLCLVWHSLRGVIDMANTFAEKIDG